jgi:hypothetical protein
MPANRPTSVELLNAVQGFLKAEVLPLLNGSEKYHLQVALNALAILGRELTTGVRVDQEEQERLRDLVGASGTCEDLNRELCARIRAGQLTYRDPQLMDHLMRTAMAKMSIDNPKYATYARALEALSGTGVSNAT